MSVLGAAALGSAAAESNGHRAEPTAAASDPASALFACSAPLALLEHFRIPFALAHTRGRADGAIETLTRTGAAGGPALMWPGRPQAAQTRAQLSGGGLPAPVPLFGRVLGDGALRPLMQAHGGEWHRAHPITGPDGAELGAIWRSDAGDVLLPFNPDEAMMSCLSEGYLRIAGGGNRATLRRALMTGYYAARPMLPRRLQIGLRRQFARVQARRPFPRWPVESCLHDFLEMMLELLTGVAGEPVPSIAAWPNGRTWALVLTHDVERAAGWEAMQPVLDLERRHGMRSSWNLVVDRCYEVEMERVSELLAQGFEVGVHGLHHDGRDMACLATWQARLPRIREAAERWGAVGYCSPAMHRRWEWMPLSGLDYDRSYPDTDPFEPQPGGCCSWLPFFNDGLVELPVTLPQDHTLFVILRRRDGAQVWIDKARLLKQRGGMALIDTHPDYLLDREVFAAYERFLDEHSGDASAWKALPREVASWWRRRASSRLERRDGGWQVIGPAAGEASVVLHAGGGAR